RLCRPSFFSAPPRLRVNHILCDLCVSARSFFQPIRPPTEFAIDTIPSGEGLSISFFDIIV
ncbi:MAG TPA: hypothetical protein PKC77_16365, partial [Sphingopyxis sp.]|nr:hypothetical protein [Sphingopyxis sp.]